MSLVDDLVVFGYSRTRAERHAALLCASFVAERLWDATVVTYVIERRDAAH
jgi:hypothetical protein